MPATPKHKKIVHDTIYQLRKREAWPDFECICHMLYQWPGLSQAEVQEKLNSLVDSKEVVIKDFNGNTSCHNATKWGYVYASKEKPQLRRRKPQLVTPHTMEQFPAPVLRHQPDSIMTRREAEDLRDSTKCQRQYDQWIGAHKCQFCAAVMILCPPLLLLLLQEQCDVDVSRSKPLPRSACSTGLPFFMKRAAAELYSNRFLSGISNGFLRSEDDEDHVLSEHGHLGQAVEEISRTLFERHVASQAVCSTIQKAASTRTQLGMPCLTRRFAAPVVGHKVGCSMERRKANQSFDSAECRLRPLNQAENKLQKDRTSHIKTVNVYQRQNCTIDPFLPLLFEEPLRCGRLLQETCTK
ncbi:hypothetical protein HPB51_012319 [Rhipicephalus microplus]|uniref:SAMD1-like winged helix (WH) domain-containing protein n=1 Tax=Rhipicephalus microplus TaxID=6941 RepID=A0A9J6D9U2_RHIMP|nr:hypothetical protein HPB51_012319 [Rhipicephalus microplus]